MAAETGAIGNELYSWLMITDAAQMTTTPKKVKDMGGNESSLYLGIGKVGFNEAVDMTKTSTEINSAVDKAAFITVTQNVDLDAIETNSNASKTKTDFITVTQNVDLDTIESRVNELDASVILKGGWDASAGTFPASGIAQAGWSYIITVAGTVDSVSFALNDRIVAILDNASTSTYASNWLKLDYTDQVLSVNGSTGAVTVTELTNANLATVLTAATTDATPLDADFVGGIKQADSSLAKWTWTVLKAFLKTYFDSVTTTFTNKRLTPRVQAVTSAATVTPNSDNDDLVTITAQAEALTIANPSGTPVSGQALLIRIKDNGTARAITFGSEYRAIGVTLPSTTVISKTMYIGLMRNAADTKWDVIGLSKEV